MVMDTTAGLTGTGYGFIENKQILCELLLQRKANHDKRGITCEWSGAMRVRCYQKDAVF